MVNMEIQKSKGEMGGLVWAGRLDVWRAVPTYYSEGSACT